MEEVLELLLLVLRVVEVSAEFDRLMTALHRRSDRKNGCKTHFPGNERDTPSIAGNVDPGLRATPG